MTLLYPRANHTAQWFGNRYPGTPFTSIRKVLLHSTETAGGWPGYGGGSVAPNMTFEPWRHEWRQHFDLLRSSRALANAGNYKTNRASVVQVEISAYCDPHLASRFGHSVYDMDDRAYDMLGEFISFCHEHGLPLDAAPLWLPYPESAGVGNGVRMGVETFDRFRGILGHQHAPQQGHGDPGAIRVRRIIDLAGPAPEPKPDPDEEELMALSQEVVKQISEATALAVHRVRLAVHGNDRARWTIGQYLYWLLGNIKENRRQTLVVRAENVKLRAILDAVVTKIGLTQSDVRDTREEVEALTKSQDEQDQALEKIVDALYPEHSKIEGAR